MTDNELEKFLLEFAKILESKPDKMLFSKGNIKFMVKEALKKT